MFHVAPPNKLERHTQRCSDVGAKLHVKSRHADDYTKFTQHRSGASASSWLTTKVLSQIQFSDTIVNNGAQTNECHTVRPASSFQPEPSKVQGMIHTTARLAVRIPCSLDRFHTARRSACDLTRKQSYCAYISGDPRPFFRHHVHQVSCYSPRPGRVASSRVFPYRTGCSRFLCAAIVALHDQPAPVRHPPRLLMPAVRRYLRFSHNEPVAAGFYVRPSHHCTPSQRLCDPPTPTVDTSQVQNPSRVRICLFFPRSMASTSQLTKRHPK